MLSENINIQNLQAPPTASLSDKENCFRAPPTTSLSDKEFSSPTTRSSPTADQATGNILRMAAPPVNDYTERNVVEEASAESQKEDIKTSIVAPPPISPLEAQLPKTEPPVEPADVASSLNKSNSTAFLRSFYEEHYQLFCQHLDMIPALEQVESLTGKPKGLVIGSLLGTMILILTLTGALAYIVNDLVAFWYPAAMTLSALTAATEGDIEATKNTIYWSKYWVVFTSLRSLVDPVFSTVVWYILGVTFPYDLAKMGLLVWCLTNQNTGASAVFEKLHAPVVNKSVAIWSDMKVQAQERLKPLMLQIGISKPEKNE